MSLVLQGLTWKEVLAYLDHVIVIGSDFSDHLVNLKKVLQRMRDHNLKLKPKKCILFQMEVAYLGKVVSHEGISIDPGKVKVVIDWPVPKSAHDIQVFLGLINYHRDFLKDLAGLTEPLVELTGKDVPFMWSSVQDDAFNKLKDMITTAPVLVYPDPEEKFILDVDASHGCIGAELIQCINGQEKVVCFGSFRLTPAQRRYCTTRKELLAVVRFTRQFRHYLLGRQFLVRTDHNSLVWLMRFKTLEGQLARWLEELSQYDMVIQHRKGSCHTNADALSRIPDHLDFCDCYIAGKDLASLPCGGCSYCSRAHTQWVRFEDEVDNVVPLAVRKVVKVTEPFGMGSNWLTGKTFQELRDQQLKDKDLSMLIDWLEGATPGKLELSLASRA